MAARCLARKASGSRKLDAVRRHYREPELDAMPGIKAVLSPDDAFNPGKRLPAARAACSSAVPECRERLLAGHSRWAPLAGLPRA
jgi:hypothetical protein